MPATALARDGALDTASAPPPSVKALLAGAPRGAYTALSVTAARAVPWWQAHCERLAHSLVVLAGTTDALPSFRAWHDEREAGVPLPLASLVGEAVLPSLRAAVAGLGEEAIGRDVAAVILMHEPAAGRGGGANDDLLLPVDVVALAWTPASPPPPPSVAAVVGPPRPRPDAKDSAWVATRAPLEARLPACAADGLLADGRGRLLEGLVTNVFVVTGEGVLQTAAAGDGVLDGVTRRAVLAAAARLSIPVDLAPPDPTARSSWSEAFLTSAVAGVRPLARLEGPGWCVDFGAAPGTTTAALAAALPGEAAHHGLTHL